jgi:poly(A) polymerase
MAGDMREIWMMQPRFEKRAARWHEVDNPFSSSVRLHAPSGRIRKNRKCWRWWQEFNMAHDDVRAKTWWTRSGTSSKSVGGTTGAQNA